MLTNLRMSAEVDESHKKRLLGTKSFSLLYSGVTQIGILLETIRLYDMLAIFS